MPTWSTCSSCGSSSGRPKRIECLRKNKLEREKEAADAIVSAFPRYTNTIPAKSIRRLLLSNAKLVFWQVLAPFEGCWRHLSAN